MTRVGRSAVFGLAALALALPRGLAAPAAPAAPDGAPAHTAPVSHARVVVDTIHSPALEGNLLGDPADRAVVVLLPPGYDDEPARSYPVVVLLHGFDAAPTFWVDGTVNGFSLATAMDSLVARGAVQPMILVMPDGNNAFSGCFWSDSPVTGDWETFVAEDVVAHVDSTYRTVPQRLARGIAGHSMGGFGALRIAARNANVFSAVYATSPYGLGGSMLVDRMMRPEAWRETLGLQSLDAVRRASFGARLQLAMAALITPVPGRRPFHVALPFTLRDGSVVVREDVWPAWRSRTPAAFVARNRAGLERLRAIAFDAGLQDGFGHIPLATRALSRALTEAGIRHRFETYQGGHMDRMPERYLEQVLPFMSSTLRH